MAYIYQNSSKYVLEMVILYILLFKPYLHKIINTKKIIRARPEKVDEVEFQMDHSSSAQLQKTAFYKWKWCTRNYATQWSFIPHFVPSHH